MKWLNNGMVCFLFLGKPKKSEVGITESWCFTKFKTHGHFVIVYISQYVKSIVIWWKNVSKQVIIIDIKIGGMLCGSKIQNYVNFDIKADVIKLRFVATPVIIMTGVRSEDSEL